MSATPTFDLAVIDYVILAVYMAGVLVHGWWVSRQHGTSDDYFLAGRALTWPLIGFSLYASNMSGASFIGLMAASYQHGFAVFNYEWTATVVLVFFAAFMLPAFLQAKLFTIPAFLETRFDRRTRTAYAAFTVLAILLIDTAGALYAGGLVLTRVLPGVLLWQAVAALALVAGVYTILGGLRAVVVTDTVQAVLLILGAGAITYVGLREVGGLAALRAEAGARAFRLYRPPGDDFLPWQGLGGVFLLGFYYWTLNQFVVQRTLGARDLDQGRAGALFAGLLKLPNLALMVLPGVVAVVLLPDLQNPDLAFPSLAAQLLPVGVQGLVLTALVAAMMSSLDSALNAAATLTTLDFVKPLWPDLGDDALMKMGRGFTGLFMVISAVYAPSIRHFQNLFAYFQSVLAYVVPPIVAVFLLGIFWRRANRHGGFWALVLGVACGVPLFVAKEVTGVWHEVLGLPTVHYTTMATLMFVFGTLVTVGVSLATGPARRDPMADVDWHLAGALSGWADPRVLGGALLAATLALVAVFW